MIQKTNGQAEYKHVTGEISIVCIEMVGKGDRRVRITNLPPEVPEGTVRAALLSHRVAKSTQEETWPKACRYAVTNSIKSIMITLTKHLPSHMTIAGNRVLTSYDGQPLTCYVCVEAGHMFWACPKRRRVRKE